MDPADGVDEPQPSQVIDAVTSLDEDLESFESGVIDSTEPAAVVAEL